MRDWNYRRGMWRIRICGHCDPAAHLDALVHYHPLAKTTMSKWEFTGTHSTTTASKMLKSANMPFAGSYKDRIYPISELFEGMESI
ncbi:hypothetical protein ACRC6Q_14035 [Planococcus sp. SE5232]|uniref:hypothetical protein n=1 Tax=unclassified Planococcus (in: firmicutes) TaxID=2662419 RepID=UPI001CBD5B6E|nr:hypothetical protein [Planococcus sp. 4-30]